VKNPLSSVGPLKGLASLSAAGLALAGAAEAHAAIIVTNVNKDVGFAPGDSSSAVFSVPASGAARFILGAGLTSGPLGMGVPRRFLVFNATNSSNVTFNVHKGRFVNRLPAGKKWKSAGGYSSTVGAINTATAGGKLGGGGTFTDEYFAFEFKHGHNHKPGHDYGWIEGSLTNGSYSDMTYHVDRYAYETTGIQIATGQTSFVVPEPATALLALSGALVAGASGVRRWRAARASQPQQVTAG
jgi:hypothetical protein